MDLSKPVTFRGLDLNGVSQQQKVLSGLSVERVDYSGVEGIGYTEKRAARDGMHASDVYLGPRVVELSGHIYAETSPALHDLIALLSAVLSPTSCYAEDPVNKGFLRMEFERPTEDEESFPDSVVPLFMNVRPRGVPRFTIVRDESGGPKKPAALPWNVSLFAKDPRVYISPGQFETLTGTSGSGDAINRGAYDSPLNILLNVPGTPTAGQKFTLQGFGVDMEILYAASANTLYRLRGDEGTLHTQDGGSPEAPEVLRMDLLKFNTKNHFPAAPASINPTTRPFSTPFDWTSSVALGTGSRLFWYEAYA